MKHNLFVALAGWMLSVAILPTCKKQTPDYLKAAEFRTLYAAPVQLFRGNATTGFSVTGKQNTKITFLPKAFADGSGKVVDGDVTIELIELTSKLGVMISGIMTESNGELLKSGGEFFTTAKKDGAELYINPALQKSAMTMEIPKLMSNDNMGLYLLDKRRPGSADPNPYTWTPAPDAPFGNEAGKFVIRPPRLGPLNCDTLIRNPFPTSLAVTSSSPDTEPVTGLQARLVFTDMSTVIDLPFDPASGKFNSLSRVPVGASANIVVMGEDSKGYLRLGVKAIIISENMKIDVPVSRVTKEEAVGLLKPLN